ncbi:Carboxy-terminal processing protease precursor [Borrelia crocidurae DOU]|uniref:Carboxy-terminal processing protease n=2 Tax=Borrelia crocidurae TaxID=29520 RepID=W5SMW8_9SPIR|nr:Carboxy-terminal processing protease precursor [Borrelia crocidurae DOU]
MCRNFSMKKKFLVFLYVVLALVISSSVIVESIFAQANSSKSNLSASSYGQMMMEAFNFIKKNYVEPIDDEAVFEGALQGMFKALNDPYSQYLTKKDLVEISKTTEGNYVGIGVVIAKKELSKKSNNTASDIPYIMIINAFEEGPAYRAGVRSGDYIKAIDGNGTDSMTIEQVSELLKGKAGTKVKISILRNKNLELEYDLVREKIDIETIKYSVINNDVGYIRILSFNPSTNIYFKKAFEKLKLQNIKSLILDLRLNLGGYLTDAIEIANDILAEGLIVSTKARDFKIPLEYVTREYRADSSHIVPLDMPIVALIDKYSASASEVLVGALRDNQRVYVIGEKSYGKGVIQRIVPFHTGGFKITHSKYYTPSGQSIHNVGIKPDLEIKERELSEVEFGVYTRMLNEEAIEKFLNSKINKKSLSEEEVDIFVDKFLETSYVKAGKAINNIDKKALGRYLFLQFYQDIHHNQPIYNLYYDEVLKTAYEYLVKKGTQN